MKRKRRNHSPKLKTKVAVEPDRGILLTPYDPEIERALAIAAWVARKYRNALRELAK